MVKEVDSLAQFQSEIGTSALTVVDFFAHWCGPCRNIAPFIEQLSQKYPQVKFLKVDVDKCQDIAQQYRITAMPTFLFFKNSNQVDMQRGADPSALEAKVIAHKVETNPFGSSKGHLLSNGMSAPIQMNSREARLAAFSHVNVKKTPESGNNASSSSLPTTAPTLASAPLSVSSVIAKAASSIEEDDEEEALAKAIALSMAESSTSTTDSTTKTMTTTSSTATAATSSTSTNSSLLPGDEIEDDLVPVPVNMEILSQLIDMGFSDIRGRKAIIHGQSLEGALRWLEQHQSDPDIDQPYLVKREDAERHDINGNLKPMSEEEKAQKIKELHEKAKRIREEKARKAKEDEIIREKERRERGKKIDTISEERDKILKKHELAKAKKEKEDAKKERERLLAEIARDKEIRKKNAGVLPSVLGVDGYNPSAIQYDKPTDSTSAATTSTTSSTSTTATATTTSAPVALKPVASAKSTTSEPLTKKQAVAPKTTSTKPGVADNLSPEEKVDAAIGLIVKYRLGGDGGNALRLLITFLKNITEHPEDPKYRSINMESNAFKTKLAPLMGPVNLLLAVGFEKTNEEGVDKLKYNHEAIGGIVSSTLSKLVEAESMYRAMNP